MLMLKTNRKRVFYVLLALGKTASVFDPSNVLKIFLSNEEGKRTLMITDNT